MYRKKKFTEIWDVVLNGKQDKDLSRNENVKWGHLQEQDSIFWKFYKSTIKTCRFFVHPKNNWYRASPDALGPYGILIEVKTRAINCSSPLKSLDSYPNCCLMWIANELYQCT